MANHSSTNQWEARDAQELAKEFGTNLERGLSGSEAKRRLEQYGPNSIEEEKTNPVLKFLSHFWGPIPWMIEAALILSAVAGHWEDFCVIGAMLLINSGVEFWQEFKAQNAIAALMETLAPRARVIREGKTKTIEARQLVPADVVSLRTGDVLPADVKLFGEGHLSVDESALTGESLPADKDNNAICYSGTSVKRGEARGLVVATGNETKFARTVELVAKAEGKSHFQQAVLRIGYYLMAITAVLVALVVALGINRGDGAWHVILFAMVLTIAAIPVAMPAVLSVTMAIGALTLAKMKAIVSRLVAMEEMAGLSTLCVDKTGTLTKNQLKLHSPVVFAADDEDELVLMAALTAEKDSDDPIDQAILGALENHSKLDSFTIKAFHPFDSTRKRAEAEVSADGQDFSAAKGAPQAILELVQADEQTTAKIEEKVNQLGEDGFRALGVARCQSGGQWKYLGLLPLLDPPRDDSAAVIKDAECHGIRVRMVTGDHGAIARQVARQVGLSENIRPAEELVPRKEDGQPGEESEELDREVLDADGFSKVTPEHKFRLIQAFQENDRIVGMTGDGVNDAPALKQADVGIAVSGATDAARAASDLVLTEEGLGVIVHAVEEARRIFQRMTAYATFRIAETIRVLLFVTLSIAIYNFYPVTAVMIVLLAILNDIPIIAIATDNVSTPAHPVRWEMRRVLGLASLQGIAGVIASFLLFWYATSRMNISQEEVQTLIFLKLLVAGHMTIYLTRNEGWFWQRPWPSWKLLVALESTQVLGTLASVYGVLVAPISWKYALTIWGYAIVWMFIMNCVKVISYRWIAPASAMATE